MGSLLSKALTHSRSRSNGHTCDRRSNTRRMDLRKESSLDTSPSSPPSNMAKNKTKRLPNLRHNTGIYPWVTGTCHFSKRAYPDPRVFSPAGIIGGGPGKKHNFYAGDTPATHT